METKKNTEQRASWRAQCRVVLSQHLKDKLNLDIAPENVRLITGPEDLYRWSALPNAEHIFEKQLSKHTLGTYIQIYQGVGDTFEAVPNGFVETTNCALSVKRSSSDADPENQTPTKHPRLHTSQDTFTGRITFLEQENIQLRGQATHWEALAETSQKTQRTLEQSLATAHTTIQEQKQELARLLQLNGRFNLAVTHYRSRAELLDRSMKSMMDGLKGVIEKIRAEEILADQTRAKLISTAA